MVTFYKPQKKEVEKKAIKVNCTDLDLQGRGVARDDKYVYFVEGLMPGDSANVLISNVKGKIATGKITKIIKTSDKRLKKDCALIGTCGGCRSYLLSLMVILWKIAAFCVSTPIRHIHPY